MKKAVFLLLLSFYLNNLYAQVILSESFDGTTFPSTGWYTKRTSPLGVLVWDRVTSATNPVLSPHSGAGMARYNSPASAVLTAAELGTLPLNFSSGGPYRVKFWLYRGDNSPLVLDQLEIFVNTAANITGATLLDRIYISRMQSPQEPANGWYQYAYDIPSSYNTAINYVIFKGTSRMANVIYLDDVTVESYNCYRPTNVLSSNLNFTSVDINWTAPSSGSPTGYDWELRTNGSAGSGSNGFISSGSVMIPSLSITGLAQGLQYKFYVRSNCSGEAGTWTVPVTFTTPCSAYSLPYFENFDGVISAAGIPPCMKVENPNGSNAWTLTTNVWDASFSHSVPTAMQCLPNGGGFGNAGDEWFYTVGLSLQAGKCYDLRFFYRGRVANESMEVKLGTVATAASMTTTLFTRYSFNINSYTQAVVPFTVPATGVYYVGFHCVTPNGYGSTLFIDDIGVTEVCAIPTAITVTGNIPLGAAISWTAPPCGIPDGYNWELRGSGIPGSGAIGLTASGNVVSPSAVINGLSEGGYYQFYVQTVCSGSSSSSWSPAYKIRAGCLLRSLPYMQDFDTVGDLVLPDCITAQNLDAFTTTWTNYHNQARTAPNCMIIAWDNSAMLPQNDWFFLPPFHLTAGTSYRLTFYYNAQFNNSHEALEVKYGTASNATAMSSPVVFSNSNITNTMFNQAITDFVPVSDGDYYIGFHSFSPIFSTYTRVDDIVVDYTPACDSVRAISVADVTSSSAILVWNTPFKGTPDGYEWELRTGGQPASGAAGLVSSGTLAGGSLNRPVSGLSSLTNYVFYIRSDCNALNGPWAPFYFKTACNPVQLPYTENFDASPPLVLPECTRVEDKDGVGTWRNFSFGGSYARSQPNCLSIEYDPYSLTDDWFYTSPLNLVAGNLYKLVFYYRASYADGVSKMLDVRLGSFPQSSSMTAASLFSSNSITNPVYQQVVVNFTPSSSGIQYIGFHSTFMRYLDELHIDDISVSALGLCASNNNFVINAGKTGSSYQWQLNTGSGFVDINDDVNYSGTQSANLMVMDIPHSYTGYQYRCMVDGSSYSLFELRFALSWSGTVDIDWLNPANWGGCATLPDQYTDVIIPAGKPRYPVINSNTIIRSLTTSAGTSVTVNDGYRLEIIGN